MIAVRLVIRRHVIFGAVGEKAEPVVEPPGIQQVGLMIEKVLHLGAGHGAGGIERLVHAPASIIWSHFRQNTRRWPSSGASCSWLLPMPRDRAVHGTPRQAA